MTREEWLNIGLAKVTPWFESAGYTVPKNIRATCGFPSKMAFGKKQRIGECWAEVCSKDGTFEIFLSPVLSDGPRVLDVLIHEIVHAVVGLQEKHNKVFKQCAVAMGLTGKMTATIATPELTTKLVALTTEIGAYPHAELSKLTNGEKKQTTRMLKVACDCGYTVRIAQKWIDAGLPVCPCGGEMQLVDVA